MLERLLLGLLTLALPDQSDNWRSTEENAAPTEKATGGSYNIIDQLQNEAKLRVGMLSVSLIICLAVGGYFGYSYWTERSNLHAYARNLVIALICRTFFSILFDGVVVLGSSATVEGANALLAFECICQSLVIAFWLSLTVYLHARVQRKFNSEPSIIHFEYAIPGIAVFFALIWIFGMQAEYPSAFWWFMLSPLPQWIVCSLELLYLLIQLGLVADMGRMMMKISLDNDSVSLLRKSEAIMAVLILLFWLQFGFSLGRIPLLTPQSYQYFDAFIDGSQPGLVCSALIFFVLWVPELFSKMPDFMMENEEAPKQTQEVLLTGSRGIETIDKVLKTKETGRWKNHDAVAESTDVMYSTVVDPHRLKKTLDLYKRLNVLPNSQTTILDGDHFYDCRTRHSIVSETEDSELADFRSVISADSKDLPSKRTRLTTGKTTDHVQKKNAFYASKYLILDSKEADFPKFLETRPSVTSLEKETTRERSSRDFSKLDAIITDDLVNKWLNDNLENFQGRKKPRVELEKPPQELTKVLDPKPANQHPSKDVAQDPLTQFGSQDTISPQQESATSAETSQSTTDANKAAIEPPEKDSTVTTLILTETKLVRSPISRRHFQQTFKRRYPEPDEDSSKPLGPTSEQEAAEAVGALGKDLPEVHRETKRKKSNQETVEYQPTPVPRQRGVNTPSGRVDEPPEESTEFRFTLDGVSSIPTAAGSALTDLPYWESPQKTRLDEFSSAAYSTIMSLLNLKDDLFKSRSSVPDAERSDLDVPSPKVEEDIPEDKTAMLEKFAEPANEQNMNAGVEPINFEAGKIKMNQSPTLSRTRFDSFEEQNLKRPAPESTEEEEKPSVVPRLIENVRQTQPESFAGETAVDDLSSESAFSIERADSYDSSFSLDKYYAGLMATRKKIEHSQHPLGKKS